MAENPDDYQPYRPAFDIFNQCKEEPLPSSVAELQAEVKRLRKENDETKTLLGKRKNFLRGPIQPR